MVAPFGVDPGTGAMKSAPSLGPWHTSPSSSVDQDIGGRRAAPAPVSRHGSLLLARDVLLGFLTAAVAVPSLSCGATDASCSARTLFGGAFSLLPVNWVLRSGVRQASASTSGTQANRGPQVALALLYARVMAALTFTCLPPLAWQTGLDFFCARFRPISRFELQGGSVNTSLLFLLVLLLA